jgi:hypothetical protein
MRSKLTFPSGMLYKQASTKELKTIPGEKTILLSNLLLEPIYFLCSFFMQHL